MNSAITVKGQATIPKAVREHMGVKPGDRVKFLIHSDGGVAIVPLRPASSLRGIASREGQKPVTIEEMDEAIAEGIAERFARSHRK